MRVFVRACVGGFYPVTGVLVERDKSAKQQGPIFEPIFDPIFWLDLLRPLRFGTNSL
jgi:hypothetical protein